MVAEELMSTRYFESEMISSPKTGVTCGSLGKTDAVGQKEGPALHRLTLFSGLDRRFE